MRRTSAIALEKIPGEPEAKKRRKALEAPPSNTGKTPGKVRGKGAGNRSAVPQQKRRKPSARKAKTKLGKMKQKARQQSRLQMPSNMRKGTPRTTHRNTARQTPGKVRTNPQTRAANDRLNAFLMPIVVKTNLLNETESAQKFVFDIFKSPFKPSEALLEIILNKIIQIKGYANLLRRFMNTEKWINRKTYNEWSNEARKYHAQKAQAKQNQTKTVPMEDY